MSTQTDLFGSPVERAKAAIVQEPIRPLLDPPIPQPEAPAPTPAEKVNCGRCAHLWSRHGKHGICGNSDYRDETQNPKPPVLLSFSCPHARLSAKYDPNWRQTLSHIVQTGRFPEPTQPTNDDDK